FFFFQAEDGIRDFHVTGVQTCALPIFLVLIPTAMVQRALFARWRFNLAETYAFLAYVFGHYVALGIVGALLPKFIRALLPLRLQIGRASCRERVDISAVTVSVKTKIQQ